MPAGVYFRTELHRKRAADAHKGRSKRDFPQLGNAGAKKGCKAWNKGLPRTDTIWNKGLTKEIDPRVAKMATSLRDGHKTGRITSFWLGKSVWNKGLTKETNSSVASMAEKRAGLTGDKAPCWKGGKPIGGYPQQFNNHLRDLIKKRDNYTCQLCGVPECECIRKLSVHHIDYNKCNVAESNLISLCGGCNGRVNGKREYWEQHFSLLLHNAGR